MMHADTKSGGLAKMVDLTPLKNNDMEYKEIISAIENCFKCEWDDAVHNSYKKYIEQIAEHLVSLHNIRCKIELMQKETDELKIDDINIKAENLCREADSI